MEWNIELKKEVKTVLISDDLIDDIIQILKPTALPIDPYYDSEISGDSIDRVKECLNKSMMEINNEIQIQVLRQLKLQEMTYWAEELVRKKLSNNKIYTLFFELVAFCDLAVSSRVKIKILGQ